MTAFDPKWGRIDDPRAARAGVLRAAGQAFATLGLERTGMDDVARFAGCSRGTVYRYFPTSRALREAYVEHEAARIAVAVDHRLRRIRRPDRLLVVGIATALCEVRASPALMAWFTPDATGVATAAAARSDAVFQAATAFVNHLLRAMTAVADPNDSAGVSPTGPTDTAPTGGTPRLRLRLPAGESEEWVVRVLLSLLTFDGPTPRTPAEEETFLHRFLVPALLGVATG